MFRNVTVVEKPTNTFTVTCNETGRVGVCYKLANGFFSSDAPDSTITPEGEAA